MVDNEFRPVYNVQYLESYTAASEKDETIQQGFNRTFSSSIDQGVEVGALLGSQIAVGESDVTALAARIKVGLNEIVAEANGVEITPPHESMGEEEEDDGDWLADDDEVLDDVEQQGKSVDVEEEEGTHPAQKLYADVKLMAIKN